MSNKVLSEYLDGSKLRNHYFDWDDSNMVERNNLFLEQDGQWSILNNYAAEAYSQDIGDDRFHYNMHFTIARVSIIRFSDGLEVSLKTSVPLYSLSEPPHKHCDFVKNGSLGGVGVLGKLRIEKSAAINDLKVYMQRFAIGLGYDTSLYQMDFNDPPPLRYQDLIDIRMM